MQVVKNLVVSIFRFAILSLALIKFFPSKEMNWLIVQRSPFLTAAPQRIAQQVMKRRRQHRVLVVCRLASVFPLIQMLNSLPLWIREFIAFGPIHCEHNLCADRHCWQYFDVVRTKVRRTYPIHFMRLDCFFFFFCFPFANVSDKFTIIAPRS